VPVRLRNSSQTVSSVRSADAGQRVDVVERVMHPSDKASQFGQADGRKIYPPGGMDRAPVSRARRSVPRI
jgi:hypothetical protein